MITLEPKVFSHEAHEHKAASEVIDAHMDYLAVGLD